MREYIIEYQSKSIVDLEATMDCGQSFVWQKTFNSHWQGWISDYPTQVHKIDSNKLLLKTHAPELVCRTYFQVDQNWDAMTDTFPQQDQALQAALRFAGGMILLRQPIWETTVSFILSAQKQISHIRSLILRLRKRFGKRLANHCYSFPSPQALAQASEQDLRACGLGFRAKSLSIAARQIESGEVDLNAISTMDYRTARIELQKLRGIGPKIADCICLFALGHFQAFPLDTWMIRMIQEIYFPRKRTFTRSGMEQFVSSHFGPYGGYAQQILFHWMRKEWSRTKNKGTPYSIRVP